MADQLAPLAITLGEPAGVGPDLTLAIYAKHGSHPVAPFAVYGDAKFLRARAERLGLENCPIAEIFDLQEVHDTFESALPVIDVGESASDRPGFLETSNAAIVTQSIDQAVAAVKAKKARAVVTAPIQKSNLYDAGFKYPGHTEYLAHLCAEDGVAPRPVMMLAHNDKRAIPVTIHISLKDVFSKLTTGRIVETTRVAFNDLCQRFGIEKPRIGLTGLNPHAGENGAMGHEERDIIVPAIEELKKRFEIEVAGPLPADTAFAPHIWPNYDVIIAMYHDQALIPVKAIGFDAGVNITLGLPIVRTSPDHGTALSLAGSGDASPNSMRAAIEVADRMSKGKTA